MFKDSHASSADAPEFIRGWGGWGEYAKHGRKCFCEAERSDPYSSTASATSCFEYLKTDEP